MCDVNNTVSWTTNNNHHIDNDAKVSTNNEILPSCVQSSFEVLSQRFGLNNYTLDVSPVAGAGDNAYGLIHRVKMEAPDCQSHYSIVKIAPKNEARRAHMHVTDYYARELFMYETVFSAFRQLRPASDPNHQSFDIVPDLYDTSLVAPDEFFIFEDLTQLGYRQNARTNLPSHDLAKQAIVAVAKLHAMSFVLQAKNPQQFHALISQLSDNLFTEDIAPLNIEFGKNSLRRVRSMLEIDALTQDPDVREQRKHITDLLKHVESRFKELALHCVNGAIVAPYAVICHGDFWNNNILYKYNTAHTEATDAKLIDFQMSRYAPPVLDLVHYFFTCTDLDLRQCHFQRILDIYYETLTSRIDCYELRGSDLYPRPIYEQQLRDYGIYGLIMAAFSIPFFIAESNEVVDIDSVSEAICDLPSSSKTIQTEHETVEANDEAVKFVKEYDIISERMLPIFKRRMTDVVSDMVKYQMDKL